MTLEGVAFLLVSGAVWFSLGWALRGLTPRGGVSEDELTSVLRWAQERGKVDAERSPSDALLIRAHWRAYADAIRDLLRVVHGRLGHPAIPCECGATHAPAADRNVDSGPRP